MSKKPKFRQIIANGIAIHPIIFHNNQDNVKVDGYRITLETAKTDTIVVLTKKQFTNMLAELKLNEKQESTTQIINTDMYI